MTRKEVFRAIETEREYQENRWPSHTHSIAEYAYFMEDYLRELKTLITRNDDIEIYKEAMNIMRKIIALGVACAEEHGIKERT